MKTAIIGGGAAGFFLAVNLKAMMLDIDGITGGFNFQAAWTTAYTVARSIVENQK